MNVLGISGLYHDSAAALVQSGHIVAAVQEERFSRYKNDRTWPQAAINYCLSHSESRANAVAFYEDPVLSFDRVLKTTIESYPHSREFWQHAAIKQLGEKAMISKRLAEIVPDEDRRFFIQHHTSHAASAFYPSPFDRAAILVVDGVGEWATTSIFLGEHQQLRLLKKIEFPNSLGLLYSAITHFCGFKVNSGEYKLMGLAPFGTPRYADLIYDNLISLKVDGSFTLNMDFFEFHKRDALIGERFFSLFGMPRRKPETQLTQAYADVAASIQLVLGDAMVKLANSALSLCGTNNLCLAGGVALNCVANDRIRREAIADRLWIQPAAGDAGGALGAALFVNHMVYNNPRQTDTGSLDLQSGSFLGPAYSNADVEKVLIQQKLPFHHISDRNQHHDLVASVLADGQVVGRFSGRMEFGPRALGARSILADPRLQDGQREINLRIKFRESWRPFAPSILAEFADEWFENGQDNPYMLFTTQVKKNKLDQQNNTSKYEISDNLFERLQAGTLCSRVPAITHVDGSARVQTVDKNRNPDFHALIESFNQQTNCPLIVNTSFNVRGEPIVCTPEDAVRCFINTGIDVLAIEDYLVYKSELPENLQKQVGEIQYEND